MKNLKTSILMLAIIGLFTVSCQNESVNADQELATKSYNLKNYMNEEFSSDRVKKIVIEGKAYLVNDPLLINDKAKSIIEQYENAESIYDEDETLYLNLSKIEIDSKNKEAFKVSPEEMQANKAANLAFKVGVSYSFKNGRTFTVAPQVFKRDPGVLVSPTYTRNYKIGKASVGKINTASIYAADGKSHKRFRVLIITNNSFAYSAVSIWNRPVLNFLGLGRHKFTNLQVNVQVN
jgi:hypothetical protein